MSLYEEDVKAPSEQHAYLDGNLCRWEPKLGGPGLSPGYSTLLIQLPADIPGRERMTDSSSTRRLGWLLALAGKQGVNQ